MLEKRHIILDVDKVSITIAKLGIGMERNGLVTAGKKQNQSTNVNYQQELLARLANT